MLKNFKSGYEVSGFDQTAKSEKNDCAVRAIANACEVNYAQAHKYVAETFKRKKGEGTKQFISTLDSVKEMTFDEVGQLSLFNGGITRTITPLGKSPKQGGKLSNPKYKHKHALAIKDGVVIDNGNYQFDGYRRVVEAAYRVQ